MFLKKKNIKSSIIFYLKMLIVGHNQEKIGTCLFLLEGNSLSDFFVKLSMGWSSTSPKWVQAAWSPTLFTAPSSAPLTGLQTPPQRARQCVTADRATPLDGKETLLSTPHNYLTLFYIWTNNKDAGRLRIPVTAHDILPLRKRRGFQRQGTNPRLMIESFFFYFLPSPPFLLNWEGISDHLL